METEIADRPCGPQALGISAFGKVCPRHASWIVFCSNAFGRSNPHRSNRVSTLGRPVVLTAQPGSTGTAPPTMNGASGDQLGSSSAADDDNASTPRGSAT